jgi:hypothetical protein
VDRLGQGIGRPDLRTRDSVVGREGIGQGRNSSVSGPDVCLRENSSSSVLGPRKISHLDSPRAARTPWRAGQKPHRDPPTPVSPASGRSPRRDESRPDPAETNGTSPSCHVGEVTAYRHEFGQFGGIRAGQTMPMINTARRRSRSPW